MNKRFLLLAFLSIFAIKAMIKEETETIKPILVDIKNDTLADLTFESYSPKEEKSTFSIKIPALSTTPINKQLSLSTQGLRAIYATNKPLYHINKGKDANYILMVSQDGQLYLKGAPADKNQMEISNKLQIVSGDHLVIELKQSPSTDYYSAELKKNKKAR